MQDKPSNTESRAAVSSTPPVRRPKLKVGALIRVCPSERHAWYQSPEGPVRKPYTPNDKVSDGCRPRAHDGTQNV